MRILKKILPVERTLKKFYPFEGTKDKEKKGNGNYKFGVWHRK